MLDGDGMPSCIVIGVILILRDAEPGILAQALREAC